MGVQGRLSGEVLKNCYITMESLRSGFSVLECCARGWVRDHLSFGDWDMPYVSELWTLLGFLDTAHETLVRLQLRWSDGRLWVAQCFSNDPDIAHEI